MSGIDVAPAVAAALTVEERALLEQQIGAYDCPVCAQRGTPADGPAAVVLYRAGGGVRIPRLPHPACTESKIAEVDVADFPDRGRWWAHAGVATYGDGWLPIVVAEPVAATSALVGSDRLDLVMSDLLGLGLHMIAGDLPPEAPGWHLVLTGPGMARIEAPGTTFYDGSLHLPPTWREHSDRIVRSPGHLGGCVLYAGTGLGLSGVTTDLTPALERMDRSALAGRLAGALIPVIL